MGSAFNPGLLVTSQTVVQKVRRLPLKGEVVVSKGQSVMPETIVARAWLPGDLVTIALNDALGLEPSEVSAALRVQEKDTVTKGQLLGEVKALFGLLTSKCSAPVDGAVEFISAVTGHLGLRRPPHPVEVNAYLQGIVVDLVEGEAVTVETQGALVQGIFGVGGERSGVLKCLVLSPEEELTSEVDGDVRGAILVGGSLVSERFLKSAGERGAVGVIVGGILDRDLASFVGREIGVAVTGHEQVPLTVVVTEGFGKMAMAPRTFELLKSLEGKTASVNGTTQIRAGALRPEVIVPNVSPAGTQGAPSSKNQAPSWKLEIGTKIRLIRTPYFGRSAVITELPEEPQRIATGSLSRVMVARLEDGQTVTIPRANVEILMAGGA